MSKAEWILVTCLVLHLASALRGVARAIRQANR